MSEHDATPPKNLHLSLRPHHLADSEIETLRKLAEDPSPEAGVLDWIPTRVPASRGAADATPGPLPVSMRNEEITPADFEVLCSVKTTPDVVTRLKERRMADAPPGPGEPEMPPELWGTYSDSYPFLERESFRGFDLAMTVWPSREAALAAMADDDPAEKCYAVLVGVSPKLLAACEAERARLAGENETLKAERDAVIDSLIAKNNGRFDVLEPVKTHGYCFGLHAVTEHYNTYQKAVKAVRKAAGLPEDPLP